MFLQTQKNLIDVNRRKGACSSFFVENGRSKNVVFTEKKQSLYLKDGVVMYKIILCKFWGKRGMNN